MAAYLIGDEIVDEEDIFGDDPERLPPVPGTSEAESIPPAQGTTPARVIPPPPGSSAPMLVNPPILNRVLRPFAPERAQPRPMPPQAKAFGPRGR